MQPFELDPLRVETIAQERWLTRKGFYQRMGVGFGTFHTPADVEELAKRGAHFIDTFRGIPGFSVAYVTTETRTTPVILSSRGPVSVNSPACRPAFYIDGLQYNPADDFEIRQLLPLTTVAAIESYASTITAPPQYRSGSPCGVILIWTK